MPGTREFDYVIVGGGLAAASAVDGIRDVDSHGSILVIADESEPPYQRPPLSKEYLQYPDLPRSMLHIKPEDWFEGEESIRLETRQRVLVLDPAHMAVTTARGNVYRGARILLATGGRARKLEAPGADLAGAFTLRTVEDAEAIREEAMQGGRSVLVGAGFVGMELAASLTVLGVEPVVLESADWVWPATLPRELADWMQGMFERRGVEFLLGASVEGLDGSKRVESARARGRRVPCDFAVIGIGMVPNIELASDAGLAVQDGIRVDAFGETSHPHIYACGDVARFPDPVFGGTSRLEHWEHAREHGRLVGHNMAGAREEYRLLPYFFSRVFDLSLEVVGRPASADQIVYMGSPGEGPCIALCGSGDRLSGAVLLDASSEIESARTLVSDRASWKRTLELIESGGISLSDLVERVGTPSAKEKE